MRSKPRALLPRGAIMSEHCRQQDQSPLGTAFDGDCWLPGAWKGMILEQDPQKTERKDHLEGAAI